jgi:hypothetical protein
MDSSELADRHAAVARPDVQPILASAGCAACDRARVVGYNLANELVGGAVAGATEHFHEDDCISQHESVHECLVPPG